MTTSRFIHVSTGEFAWLPVISADGRYLATAGYKPTYLLDSSLTGSDAPLLIDLYTGKATVIVPKQGNLPNNAMTQIGGIDRDGSTILFRGWTEQDYKPGAKSAGFYLEETNGSGYAPAASYADGTPRLTVSGAALAQDGIHLVAKGTQWSASGADLGEGLFQVDLRTGALTALKPALPGPVGQSWLTGEMSVSADGGKIALGTSGVDYSTMKSVSTLQVYDVVSGSTQRVDTSTGGLASDAAGVAGFSISGNGRYVAFVSAASNLVEGVAATPFPTPQVYVKDLLTGAIRVASTDSAGRSTPGAMMELITQGISDDGRYVLFTSSSNYGYTELDNLPPVPSWASSRSHVFVKDMQTGAVALVNSTPDTMVLQAHGAGISGDGQVIVFQGVHWPDASTPKNLFETYAMPLPAFTPVVADDVLKSGAAASTLAAGLGNDTYYVSHTNDIVVEYANAGADTVRASVSYTLPANVENLVLEGFGAIQGTGNELDNILTGSSLDNVLSGGAGKDLLIGGGGSDVLDGGEGQDTARFAGQMADYTITGGAGLQVQAHLSGATSRLNSIEALQFDDALVRFDSSGIGGQAFRLYQAAFDRKPDLAGLGYWIAQMEQGMNLQQVSTQFIASKEFRDMFGAAPSNETFVNLLYQHVLHRAPDAAGAAWWVDVLDRHATTTFDALVQFSESPENKAALVGVMSNGIAYQPWHA
jgi:Tol biopolymer transport system component